MSWGNTASGTATDVKARFDTFGASVADVDEKFSAGPIVKGAHQAQAKGAALAIGEIVDGYPEGTTFSVSISASAQEGSGRCFLSLNYAVELPVAQVDQGEGAEA